MVRNGSVRWFFGGGNLTAPSGRLQDLEFGVKKLPVLWHKPITRESTWIISDAEGDRESETTESPSIVVEAAESEEGHADTHGQAGTMHN